MDAKTGIGFLRIMIYEGRVDTADIEKAIEIAGTKSPSASFDAASLYFVGRYGRATNAYLGFAKGTRWLAVLRRDEGPWAFEETANELTIQLEEV